MVAGAGQGLFQKSSTPPCKACGRYHAQGDDVKCPKSEIWARAEDHAQKLNNTLGELRVKLNQLSKGPPSQPEVVASHLKAIENKLEAYQKQLQAPPGPRGRSKGRAPTKPKGEAAKDKAGAVAGAGDDGEKARGPCFKWLRGKCDRENCPFLHEEKRKGERSASRGRSQSRAGKDNKTDAPPTCALPTCNAPCASTQAGGYHKFCTHEHRSEYYALDGTETACINLVPMPGADAHRLVQSSARIAREVAAATGSIAIVDPTLGGPSMTDSPTGSRRISLCARCRSSDVITATARSSEMPVVASSIWRSAAASG